MNVTSKVPWCLGFVQASRFPDNSVTDRNPVGDNSCTEIPEASARTMLLRRRNTKIVVSPPPRLLRAAEAPHDTCHALVTRPELRESLSADDLARIELAAFECGSAPESYDIASKSGSVLRTPCGQGFLNVYPDRHCWHIAGGIIANDELKRTTIHWLKQVARFHRRTMAVYSVGAEDVPLFREAGYAVNKFGEEPVLDLVALNWQGKSFEWVRRQTNYCRRQGLNIVEITSSELQCAMASELTDVFFDDLRDRVYSQPLHLLEGEFNPRVLGRRRLFVVRQQASQRTEGFLIISPMENGSCWAFETYRKRRDAVRGTIPFLFREVTDRLKSEGVRRVSLCLVPGKGVELDTAAEADARVRWLLKLWYGRLDLIFSASGQDYFKSRFRPTYIDRYLCVYPRNSWRSIISFVKTSGAFRINVWNLLRKLTVGRSRVSARDDQQSRPDNNNLQVPSFVERK